MSNIVQKQYTIMHDINGDGIWDRINVQKIKRDDGKQDCNVSVTFGVKEKSDVTYKDISTISRLRFQAPFLAAGEKPLYLGIGGRFPKDSNNHVRGFSISQTCEQDLHDKTIHISLSVYVNLAPEGKDSASQVSIEAFKLGQTQIDLKMDE